MLKLNKNEIYFQQYFVRVYKIPLQHTMCGKWAQLYLTDRTEKMSCTKYKKENCQRKSTSSTCKGRNTTITVPQLQLSLRKLLTTLTNLSNLLFICAASSANTLLWCFTNTIKLYRSWKQLIKSFLFKCILKLMYNSHAAFAVDFTMEKEKLTLFLFLA